MPATRPARIIAINKRHAHLASRVLADSSYSTFLAGVDEGFAPKAWTLILTQAGHHQHAPESVHHMELEAE